VKNSFHFHRNKTQQSARLILIRGSKLPYYAAAQFSVGLKKPLGFWNIVAFHCCPQLVQDRRLVYLDWICQLMMPRGSCIEFCIALLAFLGKGWKVKLPVGDHKIKERFGCTGIRLRGALECVECF